MSTDHYTVPIPAAAFVCSNWESLCEETRTKWGHCTLDKKYGGYVIEDKGATILVCTDGLCAVVAEKDRQARVVTFHESKSDAVSLANYTVEIPASAKICSDWASLRAAVRQRPGSTSVQKYGGFVIEEDGVVLFALDESMSEGAGRPEGLEALADDEWMGRGAFLPGCDLESQCRG